MQSPPGPVASQPGHVGALDGVRGIAILCVIAFHFGPELAPGGAFGVDVFFTLSAFLITSLLLREQDRSGRIRLKSFYWRRSARLLPALLVFLVIEAPLVAIAIGTGGQIMTSSLIVLAYIADFGTAGLLPFSEPYGHTWSLSVEEQFYLIWPTVLILLVARRARLIYAAVIFWVLGVVASVVVAASVGVTPNYFLPTGHLTALAAGTGAAFVLRQARTARPSATRWWDRPWWAVLGLLTIVAMVVTRRQDWGLGSAQTAAALASLPIAVLVLHAASAHGTFVRLLSWSPLVWFGTRSYGIYLYHVPLYYLFAAPLVPLSRTANSIVAVALALALSEVSFRFVERPIMKWSRTWKKRPGAASLRSESEAASEVASS